MEGFLERREIRGLVTKDSWRKGYHKKGPPPEASMTAKKRYVYVVGYEKKKDKPNYYSYGYFSTVQSAIKAINAYLKKHPKLKWFGLPVKKIDGKWQSPSFKEWREYFHKTSGFYIVRIEEGEFGKCNDKPDPKDIIYDPRFGFV